MAIWKKYIYPSTIAEAIGVLTCPAGSTRIIAGGTDLLMDLQQGRTPPVDCLLDVTRIKELTVLEQRGNEIFVGAALPLREIFSSPLLLQQAQALVEACNLIGGPQVRNTATLGGNVAHALPAADGAIALLALDAQAEVASGRGIRRMPLIDLYEWPGKNTLKPDEILVGFYISKSSSGQSSAFSRIMRPQGVALPIINMAAWLERDGRQALKIRISVGPAGLIPQRAILAEQVLMGKEIESETIQAACSALHEQIHFRTSPRRATSQYRDDLSEVLLKEVLTKVWNRADSQTGVFNGGGFYG